MICKTMRLEETSGEKERLREREVGWGREHRRDRQTDRNRHREELGTLWHSGGGRSPAKKTEVGERQRTLMHWKWRKRWFRKGCCMGWNPAETKENED